MKLAPTEVLIAPVQTEKSRNQSTDSNTYTFWVALTATKSDIKEAVERAYGVKVVKVRTAIIKGKRRGWGKYRIIRAELVAKEPDRKKAYVKLAKENRLDLI